MTAPANESTFSLLHVHPLHLHALRAQTHLIAQRVTYTPCGRRATSKREHVARCHTSFSSKSPFVPFCHHQQVAECARVAHLGGTASNSMARLWLRRLPNVAWHMANVRCIPIKASEALATCHLAIECERTLRQQLISYATAITNAAIVYRQSTIDEFKLAAQLEPE